MADDTKVSHPGQSPIQSDGSPEMHYSRGGNNGGSKTPWIILVVIIVVIIVLGFVFKDKLFSKTTTTTDTTAATSMKSSGYESVFLTNGQVYFGKISNKTDQFVNLEDIYYLQVNQPALQGSSQNTQQAQQQPQLSLVKLGNELHGPVDKMSINRDQILFYEEMKEDGKVMQAIREYQKNPPAVNNSQQQVPATTTPSQQAPTPTK